MFQAGSFEQRALAHASSRKISPAVAHAQNLIQYDVGETLLWHQVKLELALSCHKSCTVIIDAKRQPVANEILNKLDSELEDRHPLTKGIVSTQTIKDILLAAGDFEEVAFTVTATRELAFSLMD